MDTEPTDTEQLSPGTTDEENNNEDITETDDNFSTIRMVNAEGKSDLTKMVCLDLMTCNRTHSSLILRWVRTPYNVTDNRLRGCLIEPN